jgi:4'-phosphopantetheinyl transferase
MRAALHGQMNVKSLSDFPYPGNAGAPRPLPFDVADIGLWWCSTRVPDEVAFADLQAWLAPAEHARAARYGTAALARRYMVGRAALRYVLGGVLGLAPQRVPLERGARGRPKLAGVDNVDFNVSNTRDIVLIGVAKRAGTRIGVDVEHGGRDVRDRGLARKFCTPRERALLEGLDDVGHRRRFLRLWTCKEAMSKATGDALGAPLRHLDVELAPLRLAEGPPPYTPEHWTLLAPAVPADYVATVALWRPPGAGAAGRTR